MEYPENPVMSTFLKCPVLGFLPNRAADACSVDREEQWNHPESGYRWQCAGTEPLRGAVDACVLRLESDRYHGKCVDRSPQFAIKFCYVSSILRSVPYYLQQWVICYAFFVKICVSDEAPACVLTSLALIVHP